jgi:MFS family permease
MSNFDRFWIAQAISRFGDPVTLIALTTVTYRTTSSALLTAIAVVIATLPSAVFGFIGGAIADGLGPRRTMIACDVLRVGLIGSVPVVFHSETGLLGAYLCVFGSALCGAVFNPARIALIPQLVGPERLIEANARLSATDRTVEILGSLAAGFLVAALDELAFVIDALTFAISAVVLLMLRGSDVAHGPISLLQILIDTGSGARFLFQSAVLRANTVFSLLAQLALPVVNGLTPVLLIRRFAAGNADLGAAMFGASEASLAAGAIMAGLMLPEYTQHVRKGQLLVGGFAAYGSFLILLGLAPSILPALVLFFLMGVANIAFLVPNITISQEVTPPELRARVAGARIALLNLSWLPLVAVSGALADQVDAGVLISLAGVVTLSAAAVGAFLPVIRDVP